MTGVVPTEPGLSSDDGAQEVAALRASIPNAVHIRNGRAELLPHVHGAGVTWCGKKLLGKPETSDTWTETFLSYGNALVVTFDPERGSCQRCREAFDVAYAEAFPEGLKPILTVTTDDMEHRPELAKMLSAETLSRHFGPGGGGTTSFEAEVSALLASGIEAGTGVVHESPTPQGDAQ